jgi:hypothetical protein
MRFHPSISLRRWAAAVALGASLGAQAQPADDPFAGLPPNDRDSSALRLSGFATAGFVYTDMAGPFAFRRDVLQRSGGPGSVSKTVDSRIGLQGNWAFTDRVEGVLQWVLKPIADNAPPDQRIEWAFVSWRPAEGEQARFGRVSTDTYLESQYSSVGFAYPWVRPNLDFYGWTSLQSVDGFDYTHTWQQGGRTWRAKVLAGQRDLDVPTSPGERLTFEGRDMLGLSLSAEQNGFFAKLSYLHLRLSFASSTSVEPLLAGLRALETSPVPGIPASVRSQARALRESIPTQELTAHYGTLSVQYRGGPWLAQSEYTRGTGASNRKHLTGSLAYRRGSVTFFGTGGRALADDAPVATPQWFGTLAPISLALAANAQALGNIGAAVANSPRVAQRSVGAGLRWDFHDQAALKLQLDRFKIAPYGGGIWQGNNFEGRRANVLSVVVDTVF